MIFFREVRRKKVPVVFAQDFLQGFAERGAELLIGENEAALRVLAQNILRQRLDERLIEHLRVAQGVLRAALLEKAAFQFNEMTTQFELDDDLMGENAQGFALLAGEAPLAPVRHVERADVEAIRSAQRHARVKANVRLMDDERRLGETRIAMHVRHHQQVIAKNRMATRRGFARHFGERHADAALEPKACFIHEGDHGHGHAADVRGHLGEIVENGLRQGVEYIVTAQRGQAGWLVWRYERACGGFFQPVGDAM